MKEIDYKARILQSAEEIINKQGLKGLTVANIVQHSKISNRNFYECFSSKKELLAELKESFKITDIEIPDERKLILEKAEEGISHYGFNNITLETIAKSAGINRGIIYKHFSDKYELLECCVEYQFDKVKMIVSMIYRENAEKPETFIKTYMENFVFFLNHSQDSSLYTEAWSHLNYRKKIRKYTLGLQEHIREHFYKCLKTGIEQGIFRKDLNLKAVTDFIVISLNGMAFFLGKDEKVERISKDSTDLILKTFFQMIRIEHT